MTNVLGADKVGVGTLIVSLKTKRVLLNLRDQSKSYPLCWSLWGGMMEVNESPIDALHRELTEEMGSLPNIIKSYAFDSYESNDKHFKYYSFVSLVEDEFIPTLNRESAGYAWVDLGKWPAQLHSGASASFSNKRAINKINRIMAQHRP